VVAVTYPKTRRSQEAQPATADTLWASAFSALAECACRTVSFCGVGEVDRMPSVLAAVDIASHGLVARRAQCVQSLLQ
jgi:hypothetical protein